MVLYKRKQVKIVPPQDLPQDLDTHVWYIPETKEWFLQYNDYIRRMDYLKTRNFVCEITGNSCLTFFEALQSEEDEIKEVEKNFPEALREHILRFLQFNRISRLDLLVDKVYQVFKNDYFPGENIYLRGIDNKEPSVKQRGTIREKVQYGQDQPTKDRNHFTKWLIKTFIKMTMSRSYKVGAPWVVKSKYAKKYGIPTTYPEDLKQFAETTPTGEIIFIQPKKKRGPQPKSVTNPEEAAATPKPKKVAVKKERVLTPLAPAPPQNHQQQQQFLQQQFQLQQHQLQQQQQQQPPHLQPILPNIAAPPTPTVNIIPFKKKFPTHYIPDAIMKEYEEEEAKGTPSFGLSQFQPTKKNIVDDLSLKFDLQNSKPLPKIFTVPKNAKYWNEQIAEELKDDPEEVKRLLKYGLSSILEALQTWIFINIYHNVLKIDTFTFDDFVYAMGWNSEQFQEDGQCELLDEVWCAVLGAIVSADGQASKNSKNDYDIDGLNVDIPEEPKDDETDEEDIEDEDEDHRGSESESETKPLEIDGEQSESEENGKKESKKEDDEEETENGSDEKENGEKDDDENDEPEATHNAYEVMNLRGTSWDDRLRKRNFKDGNWQCILLGLAPKDKPATALSVRNQFYEDLDIDLKFQALSILIDLISSSNIVRNNIDECLESLTVLRRNRLDNLKEQKSLLETVQRAQVYIDTILPIHQPVPAQPVPNSDPSQQEQPQPQPQSLLQSHDHKKGLNLNNLEMSDQEKAIAETNPEFAQQCQARKEAMAKLIELKDAKREIEQKLSELDCQRVKLLGKDRLYNRYWWFENNGLPNLHSRSNDDDEDDDDDTEKKKEEGIEDQEDNDGDDDDDRRRSSCKFLNVLDTIRLHNDEEVFERENLSEESSNNKIKNMNFSKIPKELKTAVEENFKLKVGDNEILNEEDEKVIDNEGSLISPLDKLSKLQRKTIEEFPDPIMNGTSWRYYDKPEDITKLISWLNPWGKRESVLRKELTNAKEAIISSMEARRKALWMNLTPPDELEIEEKIAKLNEKLKKLREPEPSPEQQDKEKEKETAEEDEDVVLSSSRKDQAFYR
ncbi:Imitation switch two complex protein 1 [Candida viswanathii]|uniref:Imitation switch two complex protein 1 n=1 Tax=Candida viswanathii TaxID=5486 RepID=A0A367XY78_9ASCO|nr:Imitation switch two complex protein 1 [Candida viswanathii]